jgi:hypothetical protein
LTLDITPGFILLDMAGVVHIGKAAKHAVEVIERPKRDQKDHDEDDSAVASALFSAGKP